MQNSLQRLTFGITSESFHFDILSSSFAHEFFALLYLAASHEYPGGQVQHSHLLQLSQIVDADRQHGVVVAQIQVLEDGQEGREEDSRRRREVGVRHRQVLQEMDSPLQQAVAGQRVVVQVEDLQRDRRVRLEGGQAIVTQIEQTQVLEMSEGGVLDAAQIVAG